MWRWAPNVFPTLNWIRAAKLSQAEINKLVDSRGTAKFPNAEINVRNARSQLIQKIQALPRGRDISRIVPNLFAVQTGRMDLIQKVLGAGTLSPAQMKDYFGVAASPTAQEQADLDLVDEFFTPWPQQGVSALRELGIFVPRGTFLLGGAPALVKHYSVGLPALARESFRKNIQKIIPFKDFTNTKSAAAHIEPGNTLWKVDPGKLLKDSIQSIQNALIVNKVIREYPFPAPKGLFLKHYIFRAKGLLRNLAIHENRLQEIDAKNYVTITVSDLLEEIALGMEKEMERQAKKKKRRAIIKAVAATAGSLLIAAVAPVVFANGISVVKNAISISDRKRQAKKMENQARLFEADNLAFSQELDRVAILLDEEEARREKARMSTKEEQEANQEVQSAVTDIRAQKGLPILVIGAGAAAIILAIILFRKAS